MRKMRLRAISTINEIIIHHSGSDFDDVHSIRAAHLRNGWADIGYHYVIKDGKVYPGRKLTYVGAHCKNHNLHSIGICVCGDYTNKVPTGYTLQTLCNLILSLCITCQIRKLSFHNDYSPTLCPGNLVNFREMLESYVHSHV